MAREDIAFRAYLEENGWDTSKMGDSLIVDEEKIIVHDRHGEEVIIDGPGGAMK